MDTFVSLLNTNAAVAFLISAVVAGLVIWLKRKPEIEKYAGLLISACKYAEKAIPDDTGNTALRRADAALKEFVKRYETLTGNTASQELKDAAALALPQVHDQLEYEGTL